MSVTPGMPEQEGYINVIPVSIHLTFSEILTHKWVEFYVSSDAARFSSKHPLSCHLRLCTHTSTCYPDVSAFSETI